MFYSREMFMNEFQPFHFRESGMVRKKVRKKKLKGENL